MALIDLVLPSSRIQLDEAQSFTVGALTFHDVTWLVYESLGDVDAAVAFFRKHGLDGQMAPADFDAKVQEILFQIITDYPELVARIIACASGDRRKEAAQKAAGLPIPVQADALLETFRLTFSAPGGVKKFVESVSMALRTLSQNLPKSLNATNVAPNTGTTS